ncbi:polysaccharide deacetylase family protein [Siccirubricoccus sp. KC 17139]|uniref:Chitooligosaccharide deacetylase n=1 Tax=Siccirubricoccus soli TaxID=2899147 RepID=A0ABT1D7S9_9PROT|nr:polysaccharide deacetylase family protein [Siccirubricoccus soli]MCP2683445.1 polysaccharide deacetylase family protein [Siccirubricoccus soli]
MAGGPEGDGVPLGRRALLAALAVPTSAPPVYLTIDTGWGREAEAIAAILRHHQIRATLFLANEPSFTGEDTLSDAWAPFWRARAAEGHVFASHTWRHWYFRGDPGPGRVRYASRQGHGAEVLDGPALCAELRRPLDRLREIAPAAEILPLWRAPGGITTPNALAMASACGLTHQGWTANGFWGDELDGTRHPNPALARRAIERTRPGEVVVLHWGVRSRQPPFAAVLEEVVSGLLARGLRFATLPPTGVR